MMPKEEFLKKFSRYFRMNMLNLFYDSIPEMFAYSFFKKKGQCKLFDLEVRCQWPILRQLGRTDLQIFSDAENIETVKKFVDLICEEKMLRRTGTWDEFNSVIRRRLALYKDIFNINSRDMAKFRKLSEMYGEKLKDERKSRKESNLSFIESVKTEKSKKFWKKVAIGAGAAAAIVGTGLAGKTIYARLKDRNK